MCVCNQVQDVTCALSLPASLFVAGLYDSIPFPSLQEQPVDYASDELLWDSAFQQEILQGLVDLGKAVEEAFDGVPQDIEGVYSKGSFTVVQSRPQVL